MEDYFLPTHVHCCRRGDAYIFLDLRQDDYVMIDGEAAAALRKIETHTELSSTDAGALHELTASGLLTTQAGAARHFTTMQRELAVETLLGDEAASIDSGIEVKIKPSHWWNFTAACTSAALSLRFRRIERTVTAVAKRKARRSAGPIDMQRARELTTVFQTLRGLFPANYLCLFDSLALIEFLARYDVYPTWIFGVRLEPWAAHCWIQQGRVAFNEDLEEAAAYTPIMAI